MANSSVVRLEQTEYFLRSSFHAASADEFESVNLNVFVVQSSYQTLANVTVERQQSSVSNFLVFATQLSDDSLESLVTTKFACSFDSSLSNSSVLSFDAADNGSSLLGSVHSAKPVQNVNLSFSLQFGHNFCDSSVNLCISNLTCIAQSRYTVGTVAFFQSVGNVSQTRFALNSHNDVNSSALNIVVVFSSFQQGFSSFSSGCAVTIVNQGVQQSNIRVSCSGGCGEVLLFLVYTVVGFPSFFLATSQSPSVFVSFCSSSQNGNSFFGTNLSQSVVSHSLNTLVASGSPSNHFVLCLSDLFLCNSVSQSSARLSSSVYHLEDFSLATGSRDKNAHSTTFQVLVFQQSNNPLYIRSLGQKLNLRENELLVSFVLQFSHTGFQTLFNIVFESSFVLGRYIRCNTVDSVLQSSALFADGIEVGYQHFNTLCTGFSDFVHSLVVGFGVVCGKGLQVVGDDGVDATASAVLCESREGQHGSNCQR